MYVVLHQHTEYSRLDGVTTIDQALERAVQWNMPAMAITDHGTTGGHVSFYQAARKRGIVPILGIEGYLVDDVEDLQAPRYHIILLAQTFAGYQNLLRLHRASWDHFYRFPRIDWAMLAEYQEGLIALQSCIGGRLAKEILQDADPRPWLERYLTIFGEERFWLEVQGHGLPEEERVHAAFRELSREYGVGIVATTDNHYADAADGDVQMAMLAIQTGKTLQQFREEGGFEGFMAAPNQYYLLSPDEMAQKHPVEYLRNTLTIAEQCQDFRIPALENPQYFFPSFAPNAPDLLRQQAQAGLEAKISNGLIAVEQRQDYQQRLDDELGHILRMGFADYFLVVADLLNWARQHDIPVGPGRGSVGGSLVAYCLDITEVDPIHHGLLFERFLNPARVSMPDIDMDIDFFRRGEVVQYVTDRYGPDRVAHIGTYTVMSAKAVLKDVARILGVPFAEANALTEAIPTEVGLTLEKVWKMPDVQQWLQHHEAIASDFQRLANALEGKKRNQGVHAAGVVIAPFSLTDLVGVRLVE